MICVGVDVAKNKHDIHIWDSASGEVLLDHLTISNTLNGFSELTSFLKPFDIASVYIACEATGHYHFNFLNFFYNLGFHCAYINPHDVKLYRDFIKKPRVKNDKIDASVIAQIIPHANLLAYKPLDVHTAELRYLTRYRTKLISKQTACKIELHTLVDSVFPEFHHFFASGIHIQSAYALLSSFPSARSIASAHLTKLANLLSFSSKGRFKKDTAISLKSLAQSSIGSSNFALEFEIQDIIEQLRFFHDKIKQVELKIHELLLILDSKITTIPGIGPTLSAIIISEIGDINRFPSPKKLVAYAGLVPSQYQSGNFIANNNHLTKQGNKYLRSAIWKAASLIWIHNPTFHDYYTKKRLQGKHHNVIIGHITKKLCSIIFAVLSKNEPFLLL